MNLMRKRKRKGKPYNRTQQYFVQKAYHKYKRTYLEDKKLMPFLILLYKSLDAKKLETRLVDAPNPKHHSHKIRTNENENPLWYKDLCSRYPLERKKKRKRGEKYIDSKIQAIYIQRAIRNFIKNGYSHSIYAEEIINIAKGLYEEQREADKLFREGEDIKTISSQYPTIIDLGWTTTEIKGENFQVAKGFPENLEEVLETPVEETHFADEIPF